MRLMRLCLLHLFVCFFLTCLEHGVEARSYSSYFGIGRNMKEGLTSSHSHSSAVKEPSVGSSGKLPNFSMVVVTLDPWSLKDSYSPRNKCILFKF